MENTDKTITLTDYRVKEHCGIFTIEVFDCQIIRSFFRKKTISGWYVASDCGGRVHRFSSPCKRFTTLEDAFEQIQKWQIKPNYYYTYTKQQ